MKTNIFLKLFFVLIFLSSSFLYSQSTEYKLQATDVLKITVHEQPDLTTQTRVTADGNITFPLIGTLYVKGLTVQELENTIKELLEKDYLVSAQVLIFIEEYHPRQVSVLGEVKNPGKYDMPDEKETTLLEAVAMAGGFTKDASVNTTRIMRMENGEKKTIIIPVKDITQKGQKEKDIVIRPGDVIFVPESFF
ncbi:polysaccharide biosynthesis/export family protein [bacterium]|jgi:polysaccharide export outer membrane protein|nr:polysaccharide biosynthesis/export family protein [bacterium]